MSAVEKAPGQQSALANIEVKGGTREPGFYRQVGERFMAVKYQTYGIAFHTFTNQEAAINWVLGENEV